MSSLKHLSCCFALPGLFFATVSAVSLAQEAERPQLSGLWTNASLTRLNRPADVDSLVVTAEEAQRIVTATSIAGLPAGEFDAAAVPDGDSAARAGSEDFGLRAYNDFWIDPGSTLARVRGEFRSSYVIEPEDGRVPRRENPRGGFQQSDFGARYATGIGDMSGPEAMPLSERCLIGFGNTAGPGMMGTLYNSTYRFVQTDDYVVIEVEMVHDARIIPVYASAEEARANQRPAAWNQWFGDSRGWYDGGELVVETVNIKPLQMEQSSVPITPEGRIIERFSRHSDSEIVYRFTVEDDNLYTRPWTAELSYHAMDGRMYEYACHEGNYSMPGVLAGARLQEAEATQEHSQ